MQRPSRTKRKASPRLPSRTEKRDEQKPLDAKHLAIHDEQKAREWVVRDPVLTVYVRALSAARKVLEHANAAEPIAKQLKRVEMQIAKVRAAYPGFEISVRAPPLPPFDAATVAQEILRDHVDAVGSNRADVLSAFLERLYTEQCTERFVVRWRAPTKARGKDGIFTSAGKFLPDQLARVVMVGVAAILELRPLERYELPIIAVAAGFDAVAKHSDARLPAEFERRADKWRQEPDVVQRRLTTLLPREFVTEVGPLVRSSANGDDDR